MRAQLPRQEHVKSASSDEKKQGNYRCFRPRIPLGNTEICFSLGKFRHLRGTCETCKCKSCIPAAIWQWFTENDENLCFDSTPKCVFLENGDDPSGALDVFKFSRKQQIVATLGNDAVFHSAQALHHRNPLPAKAFLKQKCVFPKRGCDSAAAFFLDLGPDSAAAAAHLIPLPSLRCIIEILERQKHFLMQKCVFPERGCDYAAACFLCMCAACWK